MLTTSMMIRISSLPIMTPTSNSRLPAPLPHSAERSLSRTLISHIPPPYTPPPGYAYAEQDVQCAYASSRRAFYHGVQVNISFSVHFSLVTRASVCDEEAPADACRIMLFLVRANSGWTRVLWNLVSQLTVERSRGDVSPSFTSDSLPQNGDLLRAYVDGPFRSAKRARWGNYSTGVITTDGPGVSFGLSPLQYICMCSSLAGRDGGHLGGRPGGWGWKGAELNLVRFIWLVREYSKFTRLARGGLS